MSCAPAEISPAELTPAELTPGELTRADLAPAELTSAGAMPLAAAGSVQFATATWSGRSSAELPPVAGFITSAFSPLVATLAEECLSDYFGAPPAPPAFGERIGIVLVSSTGDLTTSAAIATAIQAGKRVPPLLFYQSNHNAVAGHVAARWGLFGPVVCTMPGRAGPGGAAADRPLGSSSPLAAALAEAAASAALLIEGGDADAALVIAANAYLDGTVEGSASLVGPASWPSQPIQSAATSAPTPAL
jgi:hypothetical protein